MGGEVFVRCLQIQGEMAVIRLRKRNLILAATIGFLIGAVPLGAFGAYFYNRMEWFRTEWKIASQELDSRKLHTVYMLKEPGKKGEEILKENLVECEVYTRANVDFLKDLNELVGAKLKSDTGEHAILQKDMVCHETLSDDVRLQEFTFVELNSEMQQGSYVDIRITFPNGEDYIVAEHKRVEKREEASIFIHVSEEEILLLSSARVDMDMYDGTRVYAILYAGDYQNPATKDYPANQHVCELADWNPNIIKEVFTQESKEKRGLLELNLEEFFAEEDTDRRRK